MKKSKKILILGTMVASIFSFAGCSNNPSTNVSSPTTSQVEPNPSTGTGSSSSIVVEIPTEKVDKLVSSLNKNFTVNGNVNGLDVTIKYADDKAYYESSSGTKAYSSIEDETLYQYSLNEEEWHKNFAQENGWNVNSYSDITNALSSANWTSYDSKTNTFASADSSLKIGENQATYTFGNDFFTLSDIGSTEVALPTNFFDQTQQLYTLDENGNYSFNVVAIKDCLTDWFKGNNQWGQDAASYILNATEDYPANFEKIVYVDITNEKCEIGAITSEGEKTWFRPFYFKEFGTVFTENKLKTVGNFKKYINSVAGRKFRYKEPIEIDTEVSKEDFDTMLTNVFDRLEKVGVQLKSINNDGTDKVSGLKLENVLYGFVTPSTIEYASLDMGYGRTREFHYLMKDGNECKWVETHVKIASNLNGKDYNLLQNRENKFAITLNQYVSMDKNNADCYKITNVQENSREM